MSTRNGPEVGPANSSSEVHERRSSPRHAFSAVSELFDRRSGARIQARVADIGPQGCYADAMSVFAVDTEVNIWIKHGNRDFRCVARIAYSMPGMGMGIRFTEVPDEMGAILETWLAEARGDSPAPWVPLTEERSREPVTRAEVHVLYRLIEILKAKGLLDEVEGAALQDGLVLPAIRSRR